MKKSTLLTIKVVITGILGALGIMYIMAKPPVSEIRSYQKQAMPKPYSFGNSRGGGRGGYKSSSSNSSAADSDAISLTGKTGRYNERAEIIALAGLVNSNSAVKLSAQ